MPSFRKRPIVIHAEQYDGSNPEQMPPVPCDLLEWKGGAWHIKTLEGRMKVSPGDWCIEGVQGEWYPCKPDIFEATYEPVD